MTQLLPFGNRNKETHMSTFSYNLRQATMAVREEPRNYYGNLEEVSLGKQEKFMGNLTTDLDDKSAGSSAYQLIQNT